MKRAFHKSHGAAHQEVRAELLANSAPVHVDVRREGEAGIARQHHDPAESRETVEEVFGQTIDDDLVRRLAFIVES